ncbi:3-dehydroquinate dehydratase [Sphaerisporangium siamense]|uniref:3-dehydroquinate dehydratase n=1 Tax=Sphaerisporangium siamense TaxID=795645 RepID=A0A7W7D9H3_9ACTN|nr:type II 3-dehydroquinate dehydratase [Sphaerisporangium siamense]MBB4701885.1 5-deoxy-5-amino-3-dehydroquinate dehydratase [Sphaerisporangium siamense]GII84207.1 3-dehydroquinate dehydratase [Sphaerisporangium siamense]
MPEILLLNGPNLGILGRRQVHVYGTDTLADIERAVADEIAPEYKLAGVQRDGEGELIGAVQDHYHVAGAIVNPGALMIAGWGLRDALESFPAPWIEVHLSNVWARESFRHESITAALSAGVIAGFGAHGYRLAAKALLHILATRPAGSP